MAEPDEFDEFNEFDDFDDDLMVQMTIVAEKKLEDEKKKPLVQKTVLKDPKVMTMKETFKKPKQMTLYDCKTKLDASGRSSGAIVILPSRVFNPKRSANCVISDHIIDPVNLKTWVYPINYPLRDYQFNISQTALLSNTLVCLPTGLGKTFIAAVVMYNYFRWFPEGKIIFMAPTKPLVNQQIEACYKITGITKEVTSEMTGSVNAETRKVAWRKKRLFFMTPETFRNDLVNRIAPADHVVLVVFDEAHKASIIQELERAQAVFRVLALSATPGSDAKKAQSVITNLYIEKTQTREEESHDVKQYIFEKTTEVIVIQPTALHLELTEIFAPFPGRVLKELLKFNVYFTDDPLRSSSHGLRVSSEAFRRKSGTYEYRTKSIIESLFYLAQGMVRHLEALRDWGVRAFYIGLTKYVQEIKQKPNAPKRQLEIVKDTKFIMMMEKIEKEMILPTFFSHAKLEKLVEIVVEHFQTYDKNAKEAVERGELNVQMETRVMVFASFRDAVSEIVELLEKNSPLVRPAPFHGQSKSAKSGGAGMKQKDQYKTIADFLDGKYNVIVSTSIGEEGLDVGDLDLIVCYDNYKSAIRSTQRSGRTARKRQGKVVKLVNPGKEEASVKVAAASYKSVQKSMVDDKKMIMYDGELASILPQDFELVCNKIEIVVPEEEEKKLLVRSASATANERACMDAAHERDYVSRYLTPFIEPPILDLAAHRNYQRMHLPHLEMTRSTRSNMFVSLMQTLGKLQEDEDGPVFSVEFDALSPMQDSLAEPKVKKRKAIVFEPILEMDSDGSSDLDAPNNFQAGSSELCDFENVPPCIPVVKSARLQSQSSVGREELIDLFSSFSNSKKIAEIGSKELELALFSDPIDECALVVPSLELISSPCVIAATVLVEEDEYGMDDEFDDSFDFDAIDQVEKLFLERQSLAIPATPIERNSTNSRNSTFFRNNSTPSFVSPVGNSAGYTLPQPQAKSNFQTPLLERREKRKKLTRPAPRVRGTPRLTMTKPKTTKRKKATKNMLAQEYGLVEVEAEVSTGSSDETDEPETDLSGFVTSSQGDQGGLSFYRKSLLDGRLNEKFIQYRGKKCKEPAPGLQSQLDSVGSLEDFICDDDLVEFDTSERDIHDTQPVNFGEEPVHEMELDDMIDF